MLLGYRCVYESNVVMRCNLIRNIDNTGQIVLREVTMQYTPPSYILEHMKKHKEILGDNISTQTLVTLILNYFYTTNQDLTKVKINYSMTRTQTIKNTQRVSKTADSGVVMFTGLLLGCIQ